MSLATTASPSWVLRLLMFLIEGGRLQEGATRGQAAQDDRSIAHRAAGLVQQGGGLLRLAQDDIVFGGQRERARRKSGEVVRLGPAAAAVKGGKTPLPLARMWFNAP